MRRTNCLFRLYPPAAPLRLPTPQQFLFFYPRDAVRNFHYGQGRELWSPRSILVGPQVSRVDISFAGKHLVVCAAFRPGGLHRLLGVPVKELFDFSVDSRAVLGPGVDEVADHLAEIASYDLMVGVVESYPLRAARGGKWLITMGQNTP